MPSRVLTAVALALCGCVASIATESSITVPATRALEPVVVVLPADIGAIAGRRDIGTRLAQTLRFSLSQRQLAWRPMLWDSVGSRAAREPEGARYLRLVDQFNATGTPSDSLVSLLTSWFGPCNVMALRIEYGASASHGAIENRRFQRLVLGGRVWSSTGDLLWSGTSTATSEAGIGYEQRPATDVLAAAVRAFVAQLPSAVRIH